MAVRSVEEGNDKAAAAHRGPAKPGEVSGKGRP